MGTLYIKYTWSIGNCATWCNIPAPSSCCSLVAFNLYENSYHMNKYEPLAEEVEITEANPVYAHVLLDNGKEMAVSLEAFGSKRTSVSHLSLEQVSDKPVTNLFLRCGIE